MIIKCRGCDNKQEVTSKSFKCFFCGSIEGELVEVTEFDQYLLMSDAITDKVEQRVKTWDYQFLRWELKDHGGYTDEQREKLK